ncbi:MAG: ferrous iron transport protein A [Clostridiales bacterium]|nr:ferrous iron transport protein A [Clostridiales bacterium]
MQTLNDLKIGDNARIAALPEDPVFAARLLSFGLAPGEGIRCLLAAPGRSPRAYAVRGTTLVLRNRDAAYISCQISRGLV